MDPIAEADAIVAWLRELRPQPMDPPSVLPTSLPFYGVPVGQMRAIAREWSRQGFDPHFVAAVCDDLWGRAVREEMVVSALIHGRSVVTRSVLTVARFDRWAPNLDMWETTDQLGMSLVGPWIADDLRARSTVLRELASRANPWLKRLSLVCAAHLGRHDDVGFGPIEDTVLMVVDERRAAMPKAISWVLRSHLKYRRADVLEFVDAHAEVLPAIAVRETRRKATEGRKR